MTEKRSAPHQAHLEATHKQDASCRHYGPHAARRPHLDGARHSYRGAAATANKGTSALYSDPQVRTLDICAPASRPDMRGLDVCAQSRAGGRLRDERCAARTPRQSSGGGCFCSVALSHGSARDPRAARDDVHPEHLQSELQRHGVHALLCSPAERDSRVQVRLSPASPWLLQHLATMREATPPYLHAAWLCLVCLPSELAATRSTGSSVRAPFQPSSGQRTSAPRTGPSRSSA
jgi:hypothetical protein